MMHILFNVFCPNVKFVATNRNSIRHLARELPYLIRKIPSTILTFSGYACDTSPILEIIDTSLDSSVNYRTDICSDYSAVGSKCGVINRYLTRCQRLSSGYLLYLEYDITVDELSSKLSRLVESGFPTGVALVAFNHNAHQMTVYEHQTTLHSVTFGRPVKDNGLTIGTGCWLLDLSVADISSLGLISCPSYGYGHDDLHVSQWLKGGGHKMCVALNLEANHNEIEDPEFKKWKIQVLTRHETLTRKEYNNFWKS